MVLIQVVRNKDVAKVFSLLIDNGRFAGLPGNKFRIDENAEEVLEKIKEEEIRIKIL
jgi:hypothetical protein